MLGVVPTSGIYKVFNKVNLRYRITYNGVPLRVIWSSWSGLCVKPVPFLSSLNWFGIVSHCSRTLKLYIRNLTETAAAEGFYCCDPGVRKICQLHVFRYVVLESFKDESTSHFLKQKARLILVSQSKWDSAETVKSATVCAPVPIISMVSLCDWPPLWIQKS